jgi:hypothetical protein
VKVLFLHHNQPDYLAESLFHGLRSLLGKDCVDVPRYDSMYAPLTDGMRAKLRGHGFTLYGLLGDIPELAEDRFFWRKDLDAYDLIVIADIWSQWQLFWELSFLVDLNQLVVLDGYDTPAFFPYASLAWRLKNIPWSYFTPISEVKYFKRELIGEGASYSLDRFLPKSFRRGIPVPKNSFPISFSIPEEKIVDLNLEAKKKTFTAHIVDQELSAHLENSFFSAIGSDKYVFSNEQEYYNDLRMSKFGITTKRGGWDCLRHYELSANGCILCFRNLDHKPETCAPHGLKQDNCIVYHTVEGLMDRINHMTDSEYLKLKELNYIWIKDNTTIASAKRFLERSNVAF